MRHEGAAHDTCDIQAAHKWLLPAHLEDTREGDEVVDLRRLAVEEEQSPVKGPDKGITEPTTVVVPI
jgi:hypothetical protein